MKLPLLAFFSGHLRPQSWHEEADGLLRLCEFPRKRVLSEVTAFLENMRTGQSDAAAELLPIVYDELRRIAVARMSREKPGNTLQATALVNETWLRILQTEQASLWESRESFFAAAAEAMRRILVDAARRKSAVKNGGQFARHDLNPAKLAAPCPVREILEVNEALDVLHREDPEAAELVKLHYFAGMSLEETGELLGMSRATAYRTWNFARTFLRVTLEG